MCSAILYLSPDGKVNYDGKSHEAYRLKGEVGLRKELGVGGWGGSALLKTAWNKALLTALSRTASQILTREFVTCVWPWYDPPRLTEC